LIDGTKIDGIYTDPPYGINVPMDNSKRHGIAGGRFTLTMWDVKLKQFMVL